MKKVITGILVALMVIIPFGSAFALDQTTSGAALTPKQQQAADNKAKREAVKAALAQKRADLKAQYERNQVLRVQIKAKHTTIKASLAELRKVKNDASKAKLAEVKAALTGLTTSREALKGLRDAGKPYWQQFKTNVKAMNLEGAMSNLNSIAGVKDARYEQLTKINSVLDSIMAILARN